MKLEVLHPAAQRDQWRWREQKLSQFPRGVQDAVLAEVRRLDSADYRDANQRTGHLSRALTDAHVSRAYDEQMIRDCAENYARLCSRMQSLESRQSFALAIGIQPPAPQGANRPGVTPQGSAARLDDPLWWRRQLRKVWTRAAENVMRDIGIVRKGREPYASESAVRHRAAQKRRAREFLERSVLVNESSGEQLELLPIAERSRANPAIRRAEFMTRVRGFEEIAQDLGHVAEFVTLTTPSRFHAQLAAGGRNPTFQRAIVREAQGWLCRTWARARAKLKRLSILLYGFRIAEPHHDATPHWHVLLFVRPSEADLMLDVLWHFGLTDAGQEPGAVKHRVQHETINPRIGSATGYVAKYISKNIDGEGDIGEQRDHETDGTVADGIKRVDAWASVHGIRQFAQIGGPPVGLWREARRLRDPVGDADIEAARRCADTGDWRGFVASVGGIHAGRGTNLRLETAEDGAVNKYGECRPARVVGLRWASAVVITRPDRWRIEHGNSVGVSAAHGRILRSRAGDVRGALRERLSGVRAVRDALQSFRTVDDCEVAESIRRVIEEMRIESKGQGASCSGRFQGLCARAGDPCGRRSSGDSAPSSQVFSSLGPVAITVRGAATYNEPSAWTNPNETSQAGPI